MKSFNYLWRKNYAQDERMFPIYTEKFVREMDFIAENGRIYTILELKIIYM